MRNILLAATLLLALAMLLQASEAARNRGRRRGNSNGHMEVTCAQIRPEDICNHSSNSTKGFQVFDGCNVCTCGRQVGKMLCSIKSCLRQDKIQDGSPTKDRVDKFCTNLGRKVHRKLGRFIKKKTKKASKSKRSWPIKCFKEHKLCRKRPGAAFFDGCNRCRCPYNAGAAAAAQCETTNDCPQFYGTRREFKRRCRELGANIEGDRRQGRRRGRRGRRRGNRRRQKQQAGEESADGRGVSLMQSLLSRF